MISPVSNIYRGYKCQSMIFEESYVQASITAARKKFVTKTMPNAYPIMVSKSRVDGYKYEWPLCRKNVIYGSQYRSKHRLKHYVSYADGSDNFQVIDKSHPTQTVCPLIARKIVFGSYHSDSISAQELVVHDKKKSYDCSGQIFTDYYIQEVYAMMRNVLSGRQLSDVNKHHHLRFVKISQIDATNKIWIWHLRITETDYQRSEAKTRYILAMSHQYQLVGVYQVRNDEYVQCNTKNDSIESSTKINVEDLTLNEGITQCERCKDDTRCSCEENLHDPKRHRIL
ncbi:putative Bgh-specific protein [Blumeria hordei DH14]|uniref:Putative Bgh-specific protein n=1 Tax=Blumeria graminis f. sp. hordei (strain DH14) TaxID=546991 RepID=N1JHM5_BLUG1|nr:putative Bgh-specific protein [Blumeria hordei DH14]